MQSMGAKTAMSQVEHITRVVGVHNGSTSLGFEKLSLGSYVKMEGEHGGIDATSQNWVG